MILFHTQRPHLTTCDPTGIADKGVVSGYGIGAIMQLESRLLHSFKRANSSQINRAGGAPR